MTKIVLDLVGVGQHSNCSPSFASVPRLHYLLLVQRKHLMKHTPRITIPVNLSMPLVGRSFQLTTTKFKMALAGRSQAATRRPPPEIVLCITKITMGIVENRSRTTVYHYFTLRYDKNHRLFF